MSDGDLIVRIEGKVDEIKESTIRLRANLESFSQQFDNHAAKDDRFYTDIKDSYISLSEKLAEYNAQLTIHISGVNELKKQTSIISESQTLLRSHFNERLKPLEEESVFSAVLSQRVKLWSSAVAIVAAIVAAFKYLFHAI
jgi:uncharacterized phage infection (PIP) family protein YhgE